MPFTATNILFNTATHIKIYKTYYFLLIGQNFYFKNMCYTIFIMNRITFMDLSEDRKD